MAEIDASINEPTAASVLADRVEIYELSCRLLVDNPLGGDPPSPFDAQNLAEWLAKDIY